MPKELNKAQVLLRALPDSVLFHVNERGRRVVNYNKSFAEVCRALYAGHLKSAGDLIAAIGSGEQLNLSSWQRMAAKEGRRRRPAQARVVKGKPTH